MLFLEYSLDVLYDENWGKSGNQSIRQIYGHTWLFEFTSW